jgi:hypothetical protein
VVAQIPRPLLTGFFKSFLEQPEVAERAGFHVYPREFYSPLPLLEEIDWAALHARRTLPGIDFRTTQALRLTNEISTFGRELDPVPYDRPASGALYWLDNGFFTDFDAAALHGVLRQFKPKRYIELGCGFSSFVSSRALKRNDTEGHPCDAIYADPEPRRDVDEIIAYGRLLKQRVQALPLELFTQLEAGDVLFIDTSHVLKVQSDVERELLEILPSLQPGVLIHIHDIFSPYDYPEDWVRNKIRLSCNEQYALECLLMGGDRFEVFLPLYLLWKEHRAELQNLFARGKTRPHSFWLRSRG